MLKGFAGRICAAAILLAISCGAHAAKPRFDFNGDGKDDILLRNTATGEVYVWLMNGQTVASQARGSVVADQAWQIQGVADFDGDGKADILWRNFSTGENSIWLMNGLRVRSYGVIPTVPDQNWQIQGVGDFDGDGKADILWRNAWTGETSIWLMNGLTAVSWDLVNPVPDQAWQIQGVGDFDGDGKADILWRNFSTGENYIWLMNGLRIASHGSVNFLDPRSGWQVRGIGDFDGDGKADILWRSTMTGENYFYPMNGLTIKPTQGPLRTVADLNWQVQAVADYDGDGKADILWRNSATGESYVSLSVTNPAIPPLPVVLWSAGFEIGYLGEFDLQNVTYDAISVAALAANEGIVAHRGSWVMKQSVTAPSGTGEASGTRMYRFTTINSLYRTGNPIYYSFWAWFPQVTTFSPGGFFNLLETQSINPWGGLDPVWILGFHPSNFTLRLEWWGRLQMSGPHVGENGGRTYDTSVPIPVGQWTFIQLMVTPREDFTGAVKVWMNDALIFDIANVRTKYPESLVPAGTQSFFISKNAYGQGIIATPNSHYVDDVSISLGLMPYPP